jgi:hypothetical protein
MGSFQETVPLNNEDNGEEESCKRGRGDRDFVKYVEQGRNRIHRGIGRRCIY